MILTAKKISQKQSVWLDFIRGISAQLVLFGHLLAFNGMQSDYGLPMVQNFGVLVFFVLSGYLITQTTLLKGREYGFKRYLIDRFSRIFFSYLPALILISIFDFLLINGLDKKFNDSLTNWLANFFMLQALPFHSVLDVDAYGTARVFWTVSVEWWFYLFFGFIFFRFGRGLSHWPYRLTLLLSFVFVIFYFGSRGNGLSVYWIIGLGLSILYNFSQIRLVISKEKAIYYISSIFLIMVVRSYYIRDMYDVTLALCVAALLYILSFAEFEIIKNDFFSKFSNIIASYSYSLYLVHYSIIIYFKTLGFNVNLGGGIILFILINVFAYGYYLVFEKRFFLLKNFLKKRI